MQKRSLFFISLLVVFVILAGVSAENGTSNASTNTADDASEVTSNASTATDTDSSAPEPQGTETLQHGAGITPDSRLYFVEDKILSKFRDDSSNREKKIAELRAMVQAGNYEAARVALGNYKEYADRLEKEVDPENKEEAQRSAAAIRNVIAEIESQIPAGDRKEFVDDINEKEKGIATAAEIAGKIKDLCESLSKLDPDQYSRTCKTAEDAPQWQKKLDKDLTDEQKKEARIFINVMSQCLRDASKCRCQDITIKAFADKCSEVAPLYAQCQQGDETKCDEADTKSEGIEDLLPEHLQEIMAELDGQYSDAQLDNHFPKECREAGAKTRDACMMVMVRQNAPEECISALDSGKVKFESEKQFRKACEELMFAENAPQECIDAGIKDGRECGKFMFKQNAPQECIDAGLTGDSQSDGRKCEKLMREQRGNEQGMGGNRGPQGFAFGVRCKQMQDKEERLKCFEEAANSVQQGQHGEGEFGGDKEGGNWPEQCRQANTLTPESCRETMNSFGGQQQRQGSGFWPEECRRAGIDGRNQDDGERCSRLMNEQGEKRGREGRPEGRPEQFGPPQQPPQDRRDHEQPPTQPTNPPSQPPTMDSGSTSGSTSGTSGSTSSGDSGSGSLSSGTSSGSTSTSSDSGSTSGTSSGSTTSTSSDSGTSGSTSTSSGSTSTTTGSVIFTGRVVDNPFVRYFYRF